MLNHGLIFGRPIEFLELLLTTDMHFNVYQ